LSGYLTLASILDREPHNRALRSAFNFGPPVTSNRSVRALVEAILRHWPGTYEEIADAGAVHEAGKLNLAIDKAFHLLGWRPVWSFEETVGKTVEWYKREEEGTSAWDLTLAQIKSYLSLAQS
jgi:CDP-glucose 4,6-dehydratase